MKASAAYSKANAETSGAMWTGALVLAQLDGGDAAQRARNADLAAALMWGGNLWWFVCSAARPLGGMYMRSYYKPLEQSWVCSNSGYTTRRNNEFMFLMLGEMVLQLIVSDDATRVSALHEDDAGAIGAIGSSLLSEETATAIAGFVLSLTLMFSFREMIERQLH